METEGDGRGENAGLGQLVNTYVSITLILEGLYASVRKRRPNYIAGSQITE